MSTTQTKLSKLIDTKNEIRQTLILLGVNVPIDTPFANYPDFMDGLGDIEVTETTTDQDLLQLLDLYKWLGSAEYEDHTYTDEEIQAVHDLLDKINNGEPEPEEELPEITEPYLMVTAGRTIYYPGDTFSLDGYIIKLVYPDGNIVDITEQCTFTPTTPLTIASESVTISCTIDDVTFEYIQEVNIHKLLEYIDTTGSQYIKSGITPSSVSRIDVSFEAKTVDGNWRTVFYTELNSSPYNGVGLRVNTSKQLGFQHGANAGLAPISATANLKYNIEWYRTSDTVTINGVSYSMPSAGAMVNTEWYIFANNVAGSPAQYGVMRLYYLKFYDLDGNLIRDFRPYRDFDDVVCLRDLVEEQNIYNNGSGTFIAGDLISDDSGDSEDDVNHTELEYIQSSGSQYIDTGIYPDGTTKYELKIKNSTRNGVLFGAYNTTWETGSGLYTNVATSGQYDWVHYNSNTNTTHVSERDADILIDKGRLTINGTMYLNAATKSFTTNRTLYIFAGNMNGKVEQPTAYQLCYFKIYNSDILVRDFIPVSDINGTVCLFDKVTKSYFYNIGSGTFIAGPEKIVEEVEE
ncbi:MAG: hypothetical protein IKB64_00930 [Paludibacteraceae bacterium]|nr:hypothetical protein [Paludibacteraceae bacterium]